MKKQEKKRYKIFDILYEHIKKNIKSYIILGIVFLIGILIGIIFINNSDEENVLKIQNYFNDFVNNLNNGYKINPSQLLKDSIMNNLILSIIMWFIGSTIIGIPLIYLIILFKGFSLGCSVSSIIITFTGIKGIIFTICSLLLQNIIFIPCILALGVSRNGIL